MAFLKSLFKRRLTHADLLKDIEPLIRNPPLPPDLRASVIGMVGRSGTNLLDYWRDYFKSQLAMIAEEQSWGLQRTRLLKLVMLELGWRATYTVAQTAQSIESWSHFLNDVEWVSGASKEHWKGLLLQRWLIALLSDACLRTVGARCYALDEVKERELDLYCEFNKEIRSLDVNLLDLIHIAVAEFRDDDARFIAEFKDDVVSPLIRDQHRVLALLEDNIANGNVDLASIQAKISALDKKRLSLADQHRSDSGSPT